MYDEVKKGTISNNIMYNYSNRFTQCAYILLVTQLVYYIYSKLSS